MKLHYCCGTQARVFLLLLVLGLSAAPAQGAEGIGQVQLLEGTVFGSMAGGEEQPLQRSNAVFEQQKIRTGRKGFVTIELADGHKLSLRQNSEVVVSAFSQQSSQPALTVKLLKGGLRSVSGLIGQKFPKAFALTTPSISVGIRGTTFYTRICEQDCRLEENALMSLPAMPVAGATLPTTIDQEIPAGIYTLVIEGAIFMDQCRGGGATSHCGAIDVKRDQAGYGTASTLGILARVPRFLQASFDPPGGDGPAGVRGQPAPAESVDGQPGRVGRQGSGNQSDPGQANAKGKNDGKGNGHSSDSRGDGSKGGGSAGAGNGASGNGNGISGAGAGSSGGNAGNGNGGSGPGSGSGPGPG